jgi:hypothetical protein
MSVRVTDEQTIHDKGVLVDASGAEVAEVDYSICIQREWIRAGGAYHPVGPERRGGQRIAGSILVTAGRNDFSSNRQPYTLRMAGGGTVLIDVEPGHSKQPPVYWLSFRGEIGDIYAA